ncbi:two-component system, chemotaxis family, CheB/CheR fusion protein [Mucilaginibacter gossypiicola]|uniref:histidine kinase n=1 Tax=Mucilaginibacter gossypiicola TaxID=551995 RepID=A0A1H8KRW1_9SPHI|nr:chemotaxis protein CheB [Mucilaginibacter gossypiicola]SEN95642.1 two-component system, chemotaxis family, CheB/CheR fusion protein [Mucilaginibacter gossypiicola]
MARQTLTFSEGRANDRYIVAIGASAGGLEAIHEFFDHMPENSGFTFVVIQHLSPDYKSLLAELVAKHTRMKVVEAANDEKLQRNCVYIMPTKKLMTIKGNQLKLVDKVKDKTPNTAIDTFFFSLAKEKRDKAVAIILSGTGTDGTKGIEAVKEAGGMVMVQEPASAKFDGMPNSAITSGNADFILPPAKMHLELHHFVQQKFAPELAPDQLDDNLMNELFQLVSQNSDQDFNLYKTPTILRRIARRMAAVEVTNIRDYVALLHQDAGEVTLLAKDFLIGVTKFFRDKAAFEVLAKDIIPELIRQKQEGDLLKVWVCACSTGEEAYSVAVLINDCLMQAGKSLEVKVFATDVDEKSIEIAGRNIYPLAVAKEIPPALLKKYFVKDRKGYSVIPSIRKQIVFARHNVIKSPPFIKNDLVTCRNMLIYMNSLLQQKVVATFHYALNNGGFLFLGSSENAASIKEGITEISSKWKVYQKSGTISYGLHHTYTAATPSLKVPEKKVAKLVSQVKTIEHDFLELVTEEFDAVAIFIDKSFTVRDTIGSYRRYLNLPEKKLDLNILNLVGRDVALLLNTAIRRAWKENKKTYLNKIRVKRESEEMFLQITVKPPVDNGSDARTLLMFTETQAEPGTKEGIALPVMGTAQQQEHILEVEAELNETRANLQMAMEEMETTNEELQSSNEELLSANEELQSGNEEPQSLNEELHTLNTEHQVKIRELVELNDDLDNYFKSTDIGQIFIDAGMRIRKFNPAAVKIVNLIEADVGRPISHISSNIQYDQLVNDIHTVLSNERVVEKEVRVKDGKNYLMRIMPYIRKDKQRDGVVITFIDISVVTELNNIISGVFNASSAAILAFKGERNHTGKITDFKCIAYNSAALALSEKQAEQMDEQPSVKAFADLYQTITFEQFAKVAEGGKPLQTELQTVNNQWYQVVTAKMDDGFVISLTDISDRRNAEQKLRKNYHELITAREGLKTLNNQLEDRVFERTRKLTESEERFNLVAKATNDTIWDWNLINNTMWRSENFTLMFGYERNDDTNRIGFWFDKIHPDDRQRVQDGVYKAINHHEKNWSAEYRFLKADDTYAYILDRGSILEDEFRTPYRLVGSIIDITKQKETENNLISAQAATEELMRKKDEFMSVASHELKTPVTSLKGSLQILQRMAAGMNRKDPMVSFIDKAEKQTGKLTVLLNDLLDVTKIQEGKLQLNCERFDAIAMVRESIEEVRVQGGAHNLVFEYAEGAEITADRARLEQVINNFLTNAIKYSPNNDRVEIQCGIAGGQFCVKVKDFGIGIPENKREFLFDRFYRVQESSTHFAGLGLGLYICSEIVKRHHGKIGVESQEGKGSTFWFSVPVQI